MKKLTGILICVCLVFCFVSCKEPFCDIKEKDTEVTVCDHNWVTKVTGGSVTIASGVVTGSTDCTVLTYCTKCNANNTAFVKPCTSLAYGTDGSVKIGSWSDGAIYVPSLAIIDSVNVALTKVSNFYKPGGNHEKIKEIFLNESIEEISAICFNNCFRLEEITIPSNAVVKDNAFANCSGLSTVTFLDKVSVGSNSFSACTALKNVVSLKNADVVKDNEKAFTKCYLLIDGTK